MYMYVCTHVCIFKLCVCMRVSVCTCAQGHACVCMSVLCMYTCIVCVYCIHIYMILLWAWLLQVVKPRDFEELRSSYIKRINEMFDQLAEKYQQLDTWAYFIPLKPQHPSMHRGPWALKWVGRCIAYPALKSIKHPVAYICGRHLFRESFYLRKYILYKSIGKYVH